MALSERQRAANERYRRKRKAEREMWRMLARFPRPEGITEFLEALRR